MTRKIVHLDKFDESHPLSHMYFGWCNTINSKLLKTLSSQATLEIICGDPADPANEMHYFFDIRDASDEEFRHYGTTFEDAQNSICRDIADISNHIFFMFQRYHDSHLNMSEERKMELRKKFNSIENMICDLSERICNL